MQPINPISLLLHLNDLIVLFRQPTEQFTDSEAESFRKSGDGKLIACCFKHGEGAIGKINKDQFFFWVNQPAHLSAVGEAVKDITDYFSLILIGGEDFNRPVRRQGKGVDNFTALVAGDAFPGEDSDIGYNRSAAKGTAQFRIGTGNVLRFKQGVDGCNQIALKRAVFSLGHRFLDNLTIDEFASRFGFWQFEKFIKG